MDMTTVKLTNAEALVLDWTIRDAITAAREAVAHAICDLHDAEAYRLAAARRDALITASIALEDGISAARAVRPSKACPSCGEDVYIGMEARHFAKDHA